MDMNFEAKNKDDPDVPVQIFFAEFSFFSMYIVIVSMILKL